MSVSVIFLLPVDPRHVTADWINLDYDVAGVTPVAFVVPLEKMSPGGVHTFRDVPIITWEKPIGIRAEAEQYLLLYRITGAEYVISLGWEYQIPAGPGDEGFMISVSPLLFAKSSGRLPSRFLQIRLRRSRDE
jgi:hypothetical protein